MAVPIFLPNETFGLPDTVVAESPAACPPGKVALPATCIVAPCPTFCVPGETFIQSGGPPGAFAEPAPAARTAAVTAGAVLVVLAALAWLTRNARRRA